MHEEIISGIRIHCWTNYQNFIFMLDKIIHENLCFIENYKKIIQENTNNLNKNYINLKTWRYLNAINQKYIFKIKTIEEQRMNDHYAQLKFFKKGYLF